MEFAEELGTVGLKAEMVTSFSSALFAELLADEAAGVAPNGLGDVAED